MADETAPPATAPLTFTVYGPDNGVLGSIQGGFATPDSVILPLDEAAFEALAGLPRPLALAVGMGDLQNAHLQVMLGTPLGLGGIREVLEDPDFEEVGPGPLAQQLGLDAIKDMISHMAGGGAVDEGETDETDEDEAPDAPPTDAASRVAAFAGAFDAVLAALTNPGVPDAARVAGTRLVETYKGFLVTLAQEAYTRVPDGPTAPVVLAPELVSDARGFWLRWKTDAGPRPITLDLRLPTESGDTELLDEAMEIRILPSAPLKDVVRALDGATQALPTMLLFGEKQDPEKYGQMLDFLRAAGEKERADAERARQIRAARNQRRRERRAAAKARGE